MQHAWGITIITFAKVKHDKLVEVMRRAGMGLSHVETKLA